MSCIDLSARWKFRPNIKVWDDNNSLIFRNGVIDLWVGRWHTACMNKSKLFESESNVNTFVELCNIIDAEGREAAHFCQSSVGRFDARLLLWTVVLAWNKTQWIRSKMPLICLRANKECGMLHSSITVCIKSAGFHIDEVDVFSFVVECRCGRNFLFLFGLFSPWKHWFPASCYHLWLDELLSH